MSSIIFRLLFVGVFALAAFLPEIPSVFECALMALSVWAITAFVSLYLSTNRQKAFLIKLSVLVLAFLWALGWGSSRLDNRLAPELEGKDIWVEGRIEGLVSRQISGSRAVQRLTFQVNTLWDEQGSAVLDAPSHLRLSLYGGSTISGSEEVQGGEGWRFQVRLKRPHGFANPGGFDYERWLLSRAIGATGYVRLGEESRVPALDAGPQVWRSELRRSLIELLSAHRTTAVLLALSMGDRSLLTEADAQTIQQMGLSHLLAISGLHIGLAGAIGFLVGRMIGACLSLSFPLRFYGPHCAWLGAVAVAAAYGWMAGFSLATQRALVMLIAAAFWYCCYRRYSVWLGWWVSMMVVLVVQPLSVLEPGFWFSFVAVAVLLLLLSRPVLGWREKMVLLFKVQLALFLVMGVLQLFWSMSVSLISPLVNYLAVPYVSILVVPVILLALFVSLFSPWLAGHVWYVAGVLVDGFWWVLDHLQPLASEWLLAPQMPLHPLAVIIGCLGLLLTILPLGVFTRLLGLMSVFAVVFPAAHEHHETRLAVLDVGQGLAVVANSQNQWLLYDTGPGYSENFDAGEAVIVPFLFERGVRSIELGIVSHWDNDHGGGFESIQESVEVTRWLSGEQAPENIQRLGLFEDCSHDSQVRLGRWLVSILANPPAGNTESNNASCVVLLDYLSDDLGQGFRVLLPGDIERSRELTLLSHPWLQEPVDVLVAPHHGSGTSSSPAFVSQLSPRWVVFSSGYRNRYRHPQGQVVERYRNAEAQLLYTNRAGAVEFVLGESLAEEGRRALTVQVKSYRKDSPRYWRLIDF